MQLLKDIIGLKSQLCPLLDQSVAASRIGAMNGARKSKDLSSKVCG
jgi:hypothetical protein